jgi:hypothetical protein
MKLSDQNLYVFVSSLSRAAAVTHYIPFDSIDLTELTKRAIYEIHSATSFLS